MLCLHTDGADVTRDTVAGKIEDATGSELLSKLYEKGMSTADIVAQTLATGGASSLGSLGKGLIAVAKSFGDDFLRTFIKTYGDDATRAVTSGAVRYIRVEKSSFCQMIRKVCYNLPAGSGSSEADTIFGRL